METKVIIDTNGIVVDLLSESVTNNDLKKYKNDSVIRSKVQKSIEVLNKVNLASDLSHQI